MGGIQFIRYENDSSIAAEVLRVLMSVNDEFVPHLNTWVDLDEYSKKVSSKAVCWLAYDNSELIGFAACYVNKATDFSFWTMLAVRKEYRNRLVALQLEPIVIKYCRDKGSMGILAEVDPRHTDLINLHKYFGFKHVSTCRNDSGRSWVELKLTFNDDSLV